MAIAAAPGRLRTRAASLVLGAAALMATACGATATVAVHVDAGGSGTVAVGVQFDHDALTEIGGLGQLRTADLAPAGWTVTAPRSVPGGGAEVSAVHRFADPAQLPALLASVASTRFDGTRVDVVTMSLSSIERAGTTVRHVAGRIDLTCGLACFGDPRLRRDYGSSVGVDPSQVAGPDATATARQDLHLVVTLDLPGAIRTDDATGRVGSTLVWTVPIGGSTPISVEAVTAPPPASGSSVPVGPVTAAGVGALAVVGILVGLLVRRRRRVGGGG